ncbi:uncharacterized protein [Dermacentor andersoni]|uniref:uncharacterized protein n=1 Tax=Dermacentor andersoni TaxID=34620 RepID=UPI003B3A0CB9
MSQNQRKRYRQYLQPDSNVQVPRQTREYVLKRAKSSTAASQTNLANLSSPSADLTNIDSNENEADHLGQTDLASESYARESTSAYVSNVEGTNECASEIGSRDECSSAFELNNDDDADSQPENAAEGSEHEALEDDEFDMYFTKLSEEYLPNQTTTKAQALLLVLAYVVTSGLTWTQLQGLLTLINALFGVQVVPCSTYSVRRLWKNRKEALRIHLYCQNCHQYLGKYSDLKDEDTITCASCSSEKKLQHLMNSASFFLMFNIKQQLLVLLKQVGSTLLSNLQKIASVAHVSGVYCEITDGIRYRSVRKQKNMTWCDITLTMNTDGAPVFDASKNSIWPIQVMVNELPVLTRWQNVLISGVWYSHVHPPMHLFMKQFVEEVNSIGKLVWSHAGRTIESAVHVIVCCVDSPARAAILNRKQYNGYFGCSWCLEQGITIDGTMKYPFNSQNAPDRTHSGVLKGMVEAAQRKEPVCGIKGPSTLVKLQGLDLVWGLPPDYMHCVLEGVTKQITELWLSCTGSSWYIGRHLKLVDARLRSLRPPIIFSRSGRPLSDRAYWKAAEWRSWLLFYCLPCVSSILPRAYVTHFALLTQAVFLLLKDIVIEAEICTAEKLLLAFVQQTAKLYGESAMTFNMHQLLHLSKSARMC